MTTKIFFDKPAKPRKIKMPVTRKIPESEDEQKDGSKAKKKVEPNHNFWTDILKKTDTNGYEFKTSEEFWNTKVQEGIDAIKLDEKAENLMKNVEEFQQSEFNS